MPDLNDFFDFMNQQHAKLEKLCIEMEVDAMIREAGIERQEQEGGNANV